MAVPGAERRHSVSEPKTAQPKRKTILHMDMDAFYAAVEVLDNPTLAGKALIIGALPTERGVVSTCSYEARKYGVHSGMSIKDAYRLCPQGIYMHGHYHRYHEISDQVHEILLSYTDLIEFVALDEGYLDITGSLMLFGGAEKIGHEIKDRVLDTTGLTCSVGIGYNKMTAKLGSEEKKPNGFFVIPDPDFFVSYYRDRPVRIIPGIGGRSAAFLHENKIDTIGDLQQWDEEALVKLLGQHGHDLYLAARGIAGDTVRPASFHEQKSYGKEVTYQSDMLEKEEMLSTLKLLARSVSLGLMKRGLFASTITLKVKYNDLKQHTRSLTLPDAVQDSAALYGAAASLLEKVPLVRPVRLLGISASSFQSEPVHQITLDESDKAQRKEKLNQTLMGLYDRYGKNIVQTGGEMESRRILEDHNKLL